MQPTGHETGQQTGQSRVNITVAARLTGRAEKTIRGWLAEDPCPMTVEWGPWSGGRKVVSRGGAISVRRGRTRLLDVDELRAVHVARGGTAWYVEHLPQQDSRALSAQVAVLTERVRALEEKLESRERRERLLALPLPAPLPVTPLAPAEPVHTRYTPARPPMPRTYRAPMLGDGLPEGLMSLMDFGRQHGGRETQRVTFTAAVMDGRIPVASGGPWKVGRNWVQHALDTTGRRAFWNLWHDRDWWRDCVQCPHEVEALVRLTDRQAQRAVEEVDRALGLGDLGADDES